MTKIILCNYETVKVNVTHFVWPLVKETFRQRISRLVRKTLSFSENKKNHRRELINTPQTSLKYCKILWERKRYFEKIRELFGNHIVVREAGRIAKTTVLSASIATITERRDRKLI